MNMLNKPLRSLRDFRNDRRGAFAIGFVILSGFLFSISILGLEGSRYIAERARLSDAMEQAALALTAENNGEGAERNYTLSKAYFAAYMPREKAVLQPNVVVKYGVSPGNLSYVEYRVSGQTQQTSWFSSTFFPTFSQDMLVGGNGAARKFRSSIDVMFVVDFSGSMNEPFGTSGTKLSELKRIVLQLVRDLYQYDAGNKAGLVPFGWGAKEGSRCDFPFVPYYPMPVDILALNPTLQFQKNINVAATVAAIPNNVNSINIPLSAVSEGNCLKMSYSWKVPLTSDYARINQIQSMTAWGGTLVSSGVLRGASALSVGTAPRKVLIIVSDGTDDPEKITLTQELMNAGMCNRIRQAISTSQSVGKIAFVGINYRPTANWQGCVGNKNFYLPSTVKQLEESLHRAVFEEVGHNILKDQ